MGRHERACHPWRRRSKDSPVLCKYSCRPAILKTSERSAKGLRELARMRVISTEAAPNPVAAYSQGTEAGGVVYTAGQLGVDPATGKLFEGIEAQTLAALTNIRAIVEAAGLQVADIVKVTVFLTKMSEFDAMNAVYKQFFDGHRPARSTVGVSELPRPDAKVEIEAIAAR
jgi:2-iminobutanoate/2-iminopropanoate deaminase